MRIRFVAVPHYATGRPVAHGLAARETYEEAEQDAGHLVELLHEHMLYDGYVAIEKRYMS